MNWTSAYKGLPFVPRGRDRAGCDCWGLVRLVYAERLGIALPSYAGAEVDDDERAEVAKIFHGELDHGPWREVGAGAEVPYDIAWFKRFADLSDTHVGIVLGDGLMLHAEEGERSVSRVASYRDTFYAKLLVGFRRHDLVSGATHAA